MTEGVFFPDRAIRQAAKTFGTPFYVYDEAGLRRNTASDTGRRVFRSTSAVTTAASSGADMRRWMNFVRWLRK